MFTHPLFLIILLSITLFSSTVEIFFSADEMNDMGIQLEHPEAENNCLFEPGRCR